MTGLPCPDEQSAVYFDLHGEMLNRTKKSAKQAVGRCLSAVITCALRFGATAKAAPAHQGMNR